MVELIDNLLALARSERRTPVQPEPVDPSAVVRDVLERQQNAAREKRIQLEARVDEPAALVAAERDALVQVLDNLVGNGIKFNRAGGRVTVSIEPGPAGFVQIEVADTGIGIPPEDRERVFERFYRSRTAAGIPGTGIGLATVRNLVRRHGGVVELRSNGEGSAFRILWPRAPSVTRSATHPQS
jgi:signal transduction histidine kinase